MSKRVDTFGAKGTFDTGEGEVTIYRLKALADAGVGNVERLPFSIKILLENALRNLDNYEVNEEDVRNLASWSADAPKATIPFKPARVILQDFTGVPSVVDLAALRSAMERSGGDPKKINPVCPVDLVIDHSVQVDAFASSDALLINAQFEFERNRERYEFLHWGQKAFDGFKVVPPATGIVHQVNLEYLAKGVQVYEDPETGEQVALPDSLVGTDSHTTMINGLGVVGWGVGGIEAEAAMLGQPIYMVMPEVVGFKLTGKLNDGVTATDLVLRVTQMLREKGVVGKFVEFYGAGLSNMSLPDRATIANMAPEYGATMGFFPVDEEVCNYMLRTGRDEATVERVRRYTQEQGLFRTDDTPDPEFTDTLELDLNDVDAAMAGPQRPQDRITLSDVQSKFQEVLRAQPNAVGGFAVAEEAVGTRAAVKMEEETEIGHGSVVIAAITSCTNTSNPSVMLAAGLLAKKAVEKGLERKPYVKSSLAPGSKVVTEYLDEAGLSASLDALGFQTVGYGCTTCIGNSGPIPEPVADAVTENDLVVSAVLSGNRNFAGRISPHVKANFLASPPLVVAYALAGTVDINFDNDPIGQDTEGNDVFLKDLWPTQEEILEVIQNNVTPEMYKEQYGNVYTGNETWNAIPSEDSDVFNWQADSTYIQEPPFWKGLDKSIPAVQSVKEARVLALLGDSVTTDHISPAGAIAKASPAGRYLIENGVERKDFNTYGSRRGNHEVMMRGTFANIRLRNQLIPGSEGGVTLHVPSGEEMSIYDASMRYQDAGTDLVVLAGADYGMGSSRDWAAKGTQLLGVKAVIAKSYERIHRSNLVMMGVLPLEFADGEGWEELGLTGHESFDIPDLECCSRTINGGCCDLKFLTCGEVVV
ncbi:MAG: aconitate hydratase AcnA, partial [Chloroflexota bacterium]